MSGSNNLVTMIDEPVDAAPETAASDEPHFLQDPDVAGAFDRMLDEFSRETDRRAVLVAADIVANHLAKLIEEFAPDSFKAKRVKELLNYPGPLSTFAARADIAFMAGYIDSTAHRSIDLLRGLRNSAAHSQQTFQLGNQRAKLREMCDLGPGTALGVNRLALEMIMRSVVTHIMAAGIDLETKIGHNPFSTPLEVVDYLASRPDLTVSIEDCVPKMELAFGVWLLLGLISHQRKDLVAKRAPTLEPK